jgi:hypothetical protein
MVSKKNQEKLKFKYFIEKGQYEDEDPDSKVDGEDILGKEKSLERLAHSPITRRTNIIKNM